MYCSNCGSQNQNDANYCKKCGATLQPHIPRIDQEWEKRCEQECIHGSKQLFSLFWALIIIIIGLWIIFTILSITIFLFVAIIPVIIVIFITIIGIKILTQKYQK
jgi:uncharacterized membrane protein YvbJ